MRRMQKVAYPAVILILLLSSVVAKAEVVLIVNPGMDVSALQKKIVKRIYMGKIDSLPNGERVDPIDLISGSSIRNNFYSDVIGKTEAEMKSYWARIIFSGNGTPPHQLESSAEVKKWVANNKNSIGYIESNAADATVKVVSVE